MARSRISPSPQAPGSFRFSRMRKEARLATFVGGVDTDLNRLEFARAMETA